MENKPGFFKIIRAPFLTSILSPIIVGVLLGVYIQGSLNIAGAILVLIVGIALHIATNVYNDIYDTIQGTDKVNVHRNENSGGSGVLLDFPELMPKMFWIARISLLVALLGTIAMMFFIEKELWPHLLILYLLSAFFSKYYTAPPFKLAYRGLGEISVWFAFGPMAILIATISQNVAFHPYVIQLMPVTGLSTLSILLVGQLIDLDADKKGGKHGVASRLGTRFTSLFYLFIQMVLVSNIVLLFINFPGKSWLLLISVLPYLVIFPKAAQIILRNHNDEEKLKAGAKLTVLIHVLFSFLFIIGFLLYVILG